MRIPHSTLRQRLKLERFLGQGARGPTFGALEEGPDGRGIRCSAQSIENLRVEWKEEEILVKYLLIVRPEVGKVPLGSRVTIEDEVYRVVKCIPIPDWSGPTHVELMCDTWGSE